MSKLIKLWNKHRDEVERLRAECPHPIEMISVRHDNSSIGAGSLYGNAIVTCRDCGTKKVILEMPVSKLKKVKKQLTKQGLKNERMGGCVRYEWELE